MSTYDVKAFNTNRTVSFKIDAGAAGIFGFLPENQTVTANQRLAQLRTNAMVSAMAAYAVLVGADVDSTGQYLTVTFESAVDGTFEVGGVNSPNDLADTLGKGGMNAPKTKDGLLTLANAALLSKFGTDGNAALFSGAPTLADGTTTSTTADTASTVVPLNIGATGAAVASITTITLA